MSNNSVESRAEERLMHAIHLIGLLFFLLTAGCVGVKRTPPAEAIAVEPSMTRSIDPSVAKTGSPDAKTPAKVPASPVPAAQPLDLTALETRLKETKAIGVFTKITLKNQVDDLLNQFREYYQGRAKISLAELRQPYDRLLLKLLSLLQDGDPELARAIVTSREAIWSILADPAKFATL
jgi:hypothetical protein